METLRKHSTLVFRQQTKKRYLLAPGPLDPSHANPLQSKPKLNIFKKTIIILIILTLVKTPWTD